MPTPILNHSTPLFILFKEQPNYQDLQVFCSACYPCLKPYNNHKFQYHSKKCVYLGLAPQQKGYRCLSSTGRIYVSRHVIFDPTIFPCANGFLNRRVPDSNNGYIMPFIFPHVQNSNFTSGPSTSPTDSDMACGPNLSPTTPFSSGTHSAHSPAVVQSPVRTTSPHTLSLARDILHDSSPMSRAASSPSHKSIGPHSPSAQPVRHTMITQAQDGIFQPKLPYVGLAMSQASQSNTDISS